MAKQLEDKKTPDLLPTDLAPVPAKRGRKPVGDKPMTPAERMAAMRARKKINQTPGQVTVTFSREELCALLFAVRPELLRHRRLSEAYPDYDHYKKDVALFSVVVDKLEKVTVTKIV